MQHCWSLWHLWTLYALIKNFAVSVAVKPIKHAIVSLEITVNTLELSLLSSPSNLFSGFPSVSMSFFRGLDCVYVIIQQYIHTESQTSYQHELQRRWEWWWCPSQQVHRCRLHTAEYLAKLSKTRQWWGELVSPILKYRAGSDWRAVMEQHWELVKLFGTVDINFTYSTHVEAWIEPFQDAYKMPG